MSDLYLTSEKLPVCKLEVARHFDSLSDNEARYAHHLARASWFGTRVVLEQVSPESAAIYDIITETCRPQPPATPLKEWLASLRTKSAVSETDFAHFLSYAAHFLGNLGNYKSFGDTKFIPRIPASEFAKIIAASSSKTATDLFTQVSPRIYSLDPEPIRLIGFPDAGHVSGYYSPNLPRATIQLVQDFLIAHHLDALNTRVFERPDGSIDVKIASASTRPSDSYSFQSRTIHVSYGDFQECMKGVVEELKKALEFVANEAQKKMVEKYIESFETGSIDAHKDSQRWWIKDVGPVVESNIGFIETYRDPMGVRAEWEGFVSIVNKEQTKKFGELVANAQRFIAKLPWGRDFEKDKFNKPDFTSLEVLMFCTSGIPAGINIPNYDDIRQHEGFKNVSLANILNAQAPSEEITFLRGDDKKLFEKYRGPAFEVQVGIHELLGHGSGKLLEQYRDGKYNFDPAKPPLDPITNTPISTWYKPGETYGSVFGNMASSYEECRAECCGIYLSTDPEILKIFGHEGDEAYDITYVNWLLMVRAGLLALEFYDPKTATWGQAHMRARYAILRVLLSADSFVSLKTDSPNETCITLDRSQIVTTGRSAIARFLTQLQVYKATANKDAAERMYRDATTVPDAWLPLRDTVIAKRQPRKVFVQPNTVVDGEKVVLKEYEPTFEGLIMSFLDRGV